MPEIKYEISTQEQDKLFKKISNWIALTPPLIKPDDPPLAELPFIKDQTAIPIPYSGNSRLGFWYQHLCLQHFQAQPDYNVIADEIQLNHNGRTIGAIDFIIEHLPTKTIEHWEVAIKFYLLFDGLWYGPNSKDRLDLKLNHMLTHQLAMSQHECFQNQHPEFGTPVPKLLLQGRLYINPFQQQMVPTKILDYEINANQINGYWCFYSEWHLINEPLYILKKGQWLTGKDESNLVLTGPSEQFIHCQAESGQFWFILPDTWPHG